MTADDDVWSRELPRKLRNVICCLFEAVQAHALWRYSRCILKSIRIVSLSSSFPTAHSPTVAHHVWGDDSQSQTQEHWNLIPPAKREIRPAMHQKDRGLELAILWNTQQVVYTLLRCAPIQVNLLELTILSPIQSGSLMSDTRIIRCDSVDSHLHVCSTNGCDSPSSFD